MPKEDCVPWLWPVLGISMLRFYLPQALKYPCHISLVFLFSTKWSIVLSFSSNYSISGAWRRLCSLIVAFLGISMLRFYLPQALKYLCHIYNNLTVPGGTFFFERNATDSSRHMLYVVIFHYEKMPIQIYWKFSGKKFWYFSSFCSKHRSWVLVRTASPRRF